MFLLWLCLNHGESKHILNDSKSRFVGNVNEETHSVGLSDVT